MRKHENRKKLIVDHLPLAMDLNMLPFHRCVQTGGDTKHLKAKKGNFKIVFNQRIVIQFTETYHFFTSNFHEGGEF